MFQDEIVFVIAECAYVNNKYGQLPDPTLKQSHFTSRSPMHALAQHSDAKT